MPFSTDQMSGMEFLGIKVYESPFAVMTKPIREHKKRSNQSNRYHARIQKKWTKRFGTKQVQCAYFVNPNMLGGFAGGGGVYLPAGSIAQLRGLV